MTRRRAALAALLGGSAWATLGGCTGDIARTPTPPGELIGASSTLGHRIRDRSRLPSGSSPAHECRVVIIGAGIAGLSAARRLQLAGERDFVVLELEPRAGGTAQSGRSPVTPYPWGAHYVPAPRKSFPALVDFFDELGAFEGRDAEGEPIPAEHWLVRDPESRIFHKGSWYSGLYMQTLAGPADRADWQTFQTRVRQWVAWRDADGRRAFTVPMAAGSTAEEVLALDRISMADWLRQQGLRSPLLWWYVDYACRDDYGLRIGQTSAWAGLYYFAARKENPDAPSAPFLTWPEGNGYLVKRMAASLGKRLQLGWAVARVEADASIAENPADKGRQQELPKNGPPRRERMQVMAVNAANEVRRWRADAVIFAAPRFLAPYVVSGYWKQRGAEAKAFTYGAWAVANLHLRDRPGSDESPLCWDNVLYESDSLGYVPATHQRGPEYGPTVWTYYYPLCDDEPDRARRRLLAIDREGWAQVALADLAAPHPDIAARTERIDVMRWGHAMIRPTVGFFSGDARRGALQPFGSVFFAHSDMSGLPLFEEAFYRGTHAAEQTLAHLGNNVASLL